MTKYAMAGEVISSRIKKGKKASRNTFKKNFLSLALCWFLTAVVTFAAWGIYVFIDFLGFFIGIPLDFFAAGIALFAVLPIFAGNIKFSKSLIKKRKKDIYVLFEGYFNLKKFWLWVAAFIISISPGWLFTAVIGAVSENVERFMPFLKGETIFYISVFFECVCVVSFFFNLCKSLYFVSFYELTENASHAKKLFEKINNRYLKRKKYFRRYILAHLHLIIIMILSRAFPLYLEAVVFTIVLGYFALCVFSFSEGFELKFKKYKSERSE
jgi:hypothetical protein